MYIIHYMYIRAMDQAMILSQITVSTLTLSCIKRPADKTS